MSTKKTLILTVGLPRSGKTTWAKAQGCPIVNPDSIRWALYGQRYFLGGEKHVWAIARTMVEALFLAGNGVVILDATSITLKRRMDWIGSWEIATKTIDTPADVCIQRALINDDTEIVPVIERMAEEYEPVEAWELQKDG